jgi:hypothetical protein
MNGMRSRTHSRVNTARTDATRLAFVTADIDPDDTKLYGWIQERGPEAIEDTVNWQEEQR